MPKKRKVTAQQCGFLARIFGQQWVAADWLAGPALFFALVEFRLATALAQAQLFGQTTVEQSEMASMESDQVACSREDT